MTKRLGFVSSTMMTMRYISTHELARRHRLTAFGRWLRWQIGSRLLPFPIAVPFVGNVRLVQERGLVGSTGNFYAGLHEFSDMAFVLHFLRPNDQFLDIGANVGSYTLLAAGVRQANCLTFEPVPDTFARLRRNIAFNQLQDLVDCRRMALGSHDGEIHFTSDLDAMNRAVTEDYPGATISVPVTRLDTLSGNFREPFDAMMWKVDVEGFEHQVLTGAQNTLADRRLKAVLLEADDPEISAIMTTNGFESSSYDPWTRTLTPATGLRTSHNNHLWIRDMPFAQTRVRESDAFTVFNEQI